MFSLIGRLTARFPWVVCFLWVVLAGLLAHHAPDWDNRTQDDDVRFVPDRFTSVRAHQLISQAFPQDVSACRAVFAVERDGEPLSEDDFQIVDEIVKSFEALGADAPETQIGKVESYRDPLVGCRLISADRHCTLIQLNLCSPYLATATQVAVDRAQQRLDALLQTKADPPRVYVTGAAGIGRDLAHAAGKGLDGTTWATIALVIVVLLLVYRAPLLALVPLATIAISVFVALKMLALLTNVPGVHLVNTSKLFAIVILYGAGTDYCLFLVARYREELEQGSSMVDAIARAVGGVGVALTASAGTVMVGLGMMAFAEFAKVRYAGPAIAMSLGVALIASLTLTPAFLRILGGTVFWPGKPPRPGPLAKLASDVVLARPGFWEAISRIVANRPALVWAVSVAVLLPLVGLGLFVRPSYRATGELSPKAESLQGLAAIQRHFNAGEIGPIQIVLVSAAPWDQDTGAFDIAQLSKGFEQLPNVAEVRSLTQPLGWRPPELNPAEFGDGALSRLVAMIQPILAEIRDTVRTKAGDHYLATITKDGKPHYVTRLDVVLSCDPFEPEAAHTLRYIESWLHNELPRTSLTKLPIQAECYGITANARDLAEVTESDRARVNLMVLGAIFLILLGLVRKIWMAAYLLITVLASYYGALGATALMGLVWHGHIAWQVDWRVPYFLFVILIAVGEDYNILLVHRAIQEGRRFGPYEGMRRAISFTGGAITSCGIIMAGTFATLMLAGLGTLMQIGFALAIGALLDTFLVRPFLVPAFCMMVWRRQESSDNLPGDRPIITDALSDLLGPKWKNAA